MIENSGQCTAMRHLVAPNVDKEFLTDVFSKENCSGIDSSIQSLRSAGFADYFNEWGNSFEEREGYSRSASVPAAFKIDSSFPKNVDEEWRRIYLDVTSTKSAKEILSDEFCGNLSEWL